MNNDEWQVQYDDDSPGIHKCLRIAGIFILVIIGVLLFWFGWHFVWPFIADYVWPCLVLEWKAFQIWCGLPIVEMKIGHCMLVCIIMIWLAKEK